MQKLAALQTATKRALYEAILYPRVDNFVKYFRLQNYWTQQAGLFTMSAKRPCWHIPNWTITCSTAITTARYGTSWRQTRRSSDRPLRNWLNTTASCFLPGQDPIDGQLAQVINGFRDTYGLSVIPVSVDGVINPLLPDSRTDQGQAQRLGVKYFPAMMLVDPKQGSVRPLSYGFISQDDLAKQFLNVSEDFKPNF